MRKKSLTINAANRVSSILQIKARLIPALPVRSAQNLPSCGIAVSKSSVGLRSLQPFYRTNIYFTFRLPVPSLVSCGPNQDPPTKILDQKVYLFGSHLSCIIIKVRRSEYASTFRDPLNPDHHSFWTFDLT